MPEEGDLVDPGLAGDCAGGGPVKVPSRAKMRAAAFNRSCLGRGAPAGNPGWDIHCKYLLA